MPRPRSLEPRNDCLAALGRAIELVLRENAMTQEDLADASDMDVKQVGRYICGQGNPTFTTMRRLCAGLPVTHGDLVKLAEALEQEQGR